VKLLTGNDLKSGDVIWWDGAGWSRRIEDAVDVGETGAAILAAEEAAQRVNASYSVDAENGIPLHIKDRVRAAGPTVRQDLSINPAIQIAKA
jgi:hypothetical protein